MTELYPNAEAALASTLVIGSQSYPLFAQLLEVVDACADGFEKAWTALLRQRGTLDVQGAKVLTTRGVEEARVGSSNRELLAEHLQLATLTTQT